ncbi:MAG: hypothetical protein AAFY26_19170 [Cyanobacteria bacterium J06638_22]
MLWAQRGHNINESSQDGARLATALIHSKNIEKKKLKHPVLKNTSGRIEAETQ